MAKHKTVQDLDAAQLEDVKIRQCMMLDDVMQFFDLKNDAELAKVMRESASVVSKIRSATLALNAAHVIKIHELTGWSIEVIKLALNHEGLKDADTEALVLSLRGRAQRAGNLAAA